MLNVFYNSAASFQPFMATPQVYVYLNTGVIPKFLHYITFSNHLFEENSQPMDQRINEQNI